MTRSRLGAAAALVVLYVLATAVTTQWAPNGVRPLFDGFGSHPGQYFWVNPPKEFADGNQRPGRDQAEVTFALEGSSAARAATEDGQAMVSVVPGSLPPRAPDRTARIDLQPLDSSRLGPLPAGLRAESNAYRVSVVYLPSEEPAPPLTTPGTVGLTAAVPPEVLLFSADGETWQRLEGEPLTSRYGFTAPFTESGYYLAAGKGEPRALSGSGGLATTAFYVLTAVVLLGLGYLLLGRKARRRRPETPTPRYPGNQKKTKKKKKKARGR